MTDTSNLGLPFIEASQAQKHVTHNEALRILDAAIQITVQDLTRTAPPTSPVDGQRFVVAASPTGAWTGQAKAIATWQDGAWAFLAAKVGWCVWSVADAGMMVFDGTLWRDLRALAIDNVAHVGVNTTASAPNLLNVKSNAALLAAINAADGGTGDVRLQLAKESATRTSSVVFSDSYSGRAEFGLIGSDAFKLKVSADGSAWTDAFTIDQSSGNLALPHGLALTGVVAPPLITANQSNYNPAGAASASLLQLSSDAARSVSGLASGIDGRLASLINVGSYPITLLDESASSSAENRFTLGGDLIIPAKQAAILRYDGTAGRWQTIARPAVTGALLAANNLSDLAVKYSASDALSIHGADIASASTVNLEAATGDLIDVTGTTTIAAITLAEGHERTVRFTGTLTLTNGASLVLPGGANITTAVGDFAVFRGYASGVVRCVEFTPISGFVRAIRSQVFVSSATYTPDPHLLYAIVEMVGGGGGGGACLAAANQVAGGGGGGAGEFSRSIFSVVVIGASKAVVIGAAGSGGATSSAGSTGGKTTFGSTMAVANGGSGGSYGWAGSLGGPGSGGSSGAGTTLIRGEDGLFGDYNVDGTNSNHLVRGGKGGSSHLGGNFYSTVTNVGSAVGINANGYGNGGHGAVGINDATARAGGAGAPGWCRITEFCTQ